MEGLKIMEKSYNSLVRFRDSILSSSFSTATQLVINFKNYDMKTAAGLKTAIGEVLEAYKDELEIKSVQKALTGDLVTLKLDNSIDGFKDDLVDSIKTYINTRAPEIWNTITNSSGEGFYGL